MQVSRICSYCFSGKTLQTFMETVEKWIAFEQFGDIDKNATSAANTVHRGKEFEVPRII